MFAFRGFPLPAGGRALWEEAWASTGHVKRIGLSLPNSVSAPNWTTKANVGETKGRHTSRVQPSLPTPRILAS